MNWGWRYDLMVWFLDTVVLRGKLQSLRYRTADLAQLQSGETVLDVGCGTGTLALRPFLSAGELLVTSRRVCCACTYSAARAIARVKITKFFLICLFYQRSFKANCTSRPELALVMRPKLLPESEVFGAPRVTWLNALKNSPRS